MKKNVKFLGAAAAALLAVAPIATTGVANATTVVGGNQAVATPTQPGVTIPSITFNGTVNATTATKPSDLTSLSAVQSALKVSVSDSPNASIVGIGKTVVSDAQNGGHVVSSFQAGKTYWVQTTVAVAGLKQKAEDAQGHGQEYKVNGETYYANKNGVIENIPVAYSFTPYDSAIQGQPYFVDNATGFNLPDGAFASKAVTLSGNTTSAIEAQAKDQVTAMVNRNGQNVDLNNNVTVSGINAQLSNQGVTVSNNGTISNSASSFYITLTVVNPENNKTATVKVQFNRTNTQNNAVYPAIYEGTTLVKNGTDGSGITDQEVKKGSDRAKALANDPIKALNLKAHSIKNTDSGQIDLKVLSNTIKPDTVGVYPVTVKATNPNGYTTTLTFNVIVDPVADNGTTTRQATIKYVPGYGVNVWNILSDTARSFTGVRAMDGATVTVTGAAKTVNGISYYPVKLANGTTGYIETGFIDGATNTTKPSTDSNKEEKMSGVAVVKYNGRGGVNLLNGAGKYQNHYVYNNQAYKVFAKKIVRGELAYRLGTDSQWIPAKFVTLR